MKSTKRAFLTSVMALVLCFTMLLGTTFAWFTDTASSEGNKIVAGSLDIKLLLYKDGAYTDISENSDPIFGDGAIAEDSLNTKWEPGKTQVAYLAIENAGNLDLKYDVILNVTNNAKNLYEVMQYTITPDAHPTQNAITATEYDETAGLPIKVGAQTVSGADVVLGAKETHYFALSLHMLAEANDDYQGGEITFDITVRATQLASEKDSFGNEYDKDAIYTDFVVTSEEELKEALANAKNGAVIGIKGNVTWTTGAEHGSTPFVNSATTYSMKPAVTNLTLLGIEEGATFTAIGSGVGPIGIDNGTVTFKNLKIVDESVSYKEGAWEFGYLEFRGNTVFENCDIANAIMMEGDSATFKNCTFNSNKDNEYAVWVSNGNATFEGCTFTGPRGIKLHEAYGSEVGTVVINNNQFVDLTQKPGLAIGTVDADTTVILTNNMFAGTQAGDQNLYSYESDTDVLTFDFVCADNAIAGYADNDQELKDALKNNATVMLPEGEYTLPSMNGKEGITIVGAADGSTVVGGENASTGFGSNFGKNTTIQNVTFAGASNGVRYSYAQGGTATFDNCTFAGDSTYGFHIDQSGGATLIFNDCTFIGFNAFASDLVKVEFNNCTFLSNGSYGHTNIWSVGEFNSCTWGDNTSVSQGYSRNEQKYYGTLIFDGVEESYHHEFIGSAESLIAFAESVNAGGDNWNGQKVVLVADIDLSNVLWTPIGQTGATTFSGSFDGQGHTISNLTVDSSAETGSHYSSGLFGWIEVHGYNYTVIENVKIDHATITGNHNCGTIVGYATGSVAIKNCEVTNSTVSCNVANDDANGDKAGVIVGNLTADPETKVVNCSASDCSVSAGRDAGQLVGAGNVENVTGTATNVTVIDNGQGTGANIKSELVGRDL